MVFLGGGGGEGHSRTPPHQKATIQEDHNRKGGASWRHPPGWLLLRAVRILVECILVHLEFLLLGLSSNCNVDELEKRWLICKDHKPSPMTLLSALMHNEEEVQTSYFVIASNNFRSEPSVLCFIL